MDLNQLKTFVTVAEVGSLTKASERLYLSQPAVSAHIKSLESELDVVLFNRTPKGMSLTLAGHALKQDAAKALEAAKHVFSRAQSFKAGVGGDCLIGTVSEPVILRLSELLSALMSANPNLSLRLSQCISGVVVERLLEGKLHGGYVIGDVEDRRIASIPVRPIHLRIVAPYDWGNRIEHAQWADLAQMPWIAMPPKCSFHHITANMFARHGLTPNGIVTVDQEATVRKLVASGMGLALLREDLARDAADQQEVVIWPHGVETSHLYFVYAHAEALSPTVQALTRAVQAVWHPDELAEAVPLQHG